MWFQKTDLLCPVIFSIFGKKFLNSVIFHSNCQNKETLFFSKIFFVLLIYFSLIGPFLIRRNVLNTIVTFYYTIQFPFFIVVEDFKIF